MFFTNHSCCQSVIFLYKTFGITFQSFWPWRRRQEIPRKYLWFLALRHSATLKILHTKHEALWVSNLSFSIPLANVCMLQVIWTHTLYWICRANTGCHLPLAPHIQWNTALPFVCYVHYSLVSDLPPRRKGCLYARQETNVWWYGGEYRLCRKSRR